MDSSQETSAQVACFASLIRQPVKARKRTRSAQSFACAARFNESYQPIQLLRRWKLQFLVPHPQPLQPHRGVCIMPKTSQGEDAPQGVHRVIEYGRRVVRRVACRPLSAICFLDAVRLELVHSRPRLNQTFNAAQPVGLGQGRKGVIVLCLGFVLQPAILNVPTSALGLRNSLSLSGSRNLAVVNTSVSNFGETACLCAERVQNTHRLARTASRTALLEMTAKGRLAIRVEFALWFSGCLLQPPFCL